METIFNILMALFERVVNMFKRKEHGLVFEKYVHADKNTNINVSITVINPVINIKK